MRNHRFKLVWFGLSAVLAVALAALTWPGRTLSNSDEEIEAAIDPIIEHPRFAGDSGNDGWNLLEASNQAMRATFRNWNFSQNLESSNADLKPALKALASCEPELGRIDLALKQDSLHIVDTTDPINGVMPLVDVFFFLRLRCDVALIRGDRERLLQELRRFALFARLVQVATGSMLVRFLQYKVESTLLSRLNHAVRKNLIDESGMAELLSKLPEAPIDDPVSVQSLQISFYARLALLRDRAALEKLFASLEIEPKEIYLPVGDHDVATSVRKDSMVTAAMIRNIRWRSWKSRSLKEIEAYEDYVYSAYANQMLWPSWRRVVSRFDQNPFGKHVGIFLKPNDDRLSFGWRANREATRLLLGVGIYRSRHSRLPASLGQLVESRVLPSIPRDFFADAPMRYLPQKGLAYSLGMNGIDDTGGRMDIVVKF